VLIMLFDTFAATLLLLQVLGLSAAAVTFAAHLAHVGAHPEPAVARPVATVEPRPVPAAQPAFAR